MPVNRVNNTWIKAMPSLLLRRKKNDFLTCINCLQTVLDCHCFLNATTMPSGVCFFNIFPSIFFEKMGYPGGLDSKESACTVGDWGSIPGLGRFPRVGNGNPLQYICLENCVDRGAWQATVHGVTELDTTKQLTLSHTSFEKKNSGRQQQL